MKISQAVEFLEKVKEREGDIRIRTLTGFWVLVVPETGEKVIVCSVGDGKSLDDLVR